MPSPFPEKFVERSGGAARRANANGHPPLPRYLVERLLLDTSGYLAAAGCRAISERAASAKCRRPASDWRPAGLTVPAVEAIARYQWAGAGAGGRRHAAGETPGDAQRPDRPRADASRVGHAGFRRADAADVPGRLFRAGPVRRELAARQADGAGQRGRCAAWCPRGRCNRCSSLA